MKKSKKYLYHGSDHIIEEPLYGGGRSDNDYGNGFYCTENQELALEWASLTRSGGIVNKYTIDEAGLNIMDLSSEHYNVLNWLAILLNNRSIRISSAIEKAGKQYIIEHFMPDTGGTDIIIGYRADDSFFSFARAFLSNTLSYQQLEQVLKYGDLGLQYVLVSRRSFEKITFISAEAVDGEVFYPLRKKRDGRARSDYRHLIRSLDIDGLFLNQIIREGITDERLQ